MEELTIYLEDGRRVRELTERVAVLEGEKARLEERVRDLEFKYRCESVVNMESWVMPVTVLSVPAVEKNGLNSPSTGNMLIRKGSVSLLRFSFLVHPANAPHVNASNTARITQTLFFILLSTSLSD